MERHYIQQLYSDVIFTIESLTDLVPKEKLNNRKYVKYIDILKSFIEAPSQINEQRSREIINQIHVCTACKCYKCEKDCTMEGCRRCEPSGYIAKCDNNKLSLYKFRNKTLTLKNSDYNYTTKYKVLYILEDKEYDQFYMVLQSGSIKYLVYYYPGVKGDKFNAIKDVEDFNFAVRTVEDSELEEDYAFSTKNRELSIDQSKPIKKKLISKGPIITLIAAAFFTGLILFPSLRHINSTSTLKNTISNSQNNSINQSKNNSVTKDKIINTQKQIADERDIKIAAILKKNYSKKYIEESTDVSLINGTSFVVKDDSQSSLIEVDSEIKHTSYDANTIETSIKVVNFINEFNEDNTLDTNIFKILKLYDANIDTDEIIRLINESLSETGDIDNFNNGMNFGKTQVRVYRNYIAGIGRLVIEASSKVKLK